MLFVLAVALVVAGMDVVGSLTGYGARLWLAKPLAGVPTYFHGLVAGATLGTIFVASVRKMLEMRAGGGMAVAQMMGARLLRRRTANPRERRLLDVVDEMAIASGTRVPLVYVMDAHGGINSFAAGCDASQAVVVTRGTLEALNRSLFMQSTWQSGNVMSRWYADLARRWAKVEYITIPAKREAIDGAHRLVIHP